MRRATLCLTSVLIIFVLAACRPPTPPPSGSQAEPTTVQATPDRPGPTAPLATAPTASTGPAEGPTAEFKEALSAREAFVAAEAEARAQSTDYQLYEVLGCHKAASYGHYERDSHLVEGTCAQWLFHYVRPVDPDSSKGYHALFVRVGPNGVLETTEEPHVEQVRKRARGDIAGWRVDSPQAIAIAESEGGRAYRKANPEWDTARFEADRNAILMATLQFAPYWDADSGKDFAGSEGPVWVVKYPPLEALLFVIDAATGEVLLATGTGG